MKQLCFNIGTDRGTFVKSSLVILGRMTMNGIVASKNGTYSWSSIYQIFRNGQIIIGHDVNHQTAVKSTPSNR